MLALSNYSEETQPLFRLLETEAFRFVIVRFNHYDLINQLKRDLQKFASRPFAEIDGSTASYRQLMDAYYQTGSGIFCIDNFAALIQRPEVYEGLNQRRDKLAQYPIAIMALVEPPALENFFKDLIKKMPDMWSFRSLLLDLRQEIAAKVEGTSMLVANRDVSISSLGGHTQAEKMGELERLLHLVGTTPPHETSFLKTQYRQIAQLQMDTGRYNEAINTYKRLVELAGDDAERAGYCIEKGDALNVLGNLQAALNAYQTAQALLAQQAHAYEYGRVLSRLGQTYADLGNLPEALRFYQDCNRLREELYNAYPDNVNFKYGLAVAYSKLGETHADLGNLPEALRFYELDADLSKQLFDAYPDNVNFKNGLAVSYEKLGQTYADLGNLPEALRFYQDYNKLMEELYNAYPDNVNFKNGLAISYEKLGETHAALGNPAKALEFYELRSALGKQLFDAYPDNVNFKYGLAIAYQFQGNTHADLGNLPEALRFYQDYNKLIEELYNAYPDNVNFKYGLAISFYQLGTAHGANGYRAQQKQYFQQAQQLWQQLAADFPDYAEFGRNLGIINGLLAQG